MSPATPYKDIRHSAAAALNTPTQAVTSDLIKLEISPTKGDRAAAGKDKPTADKRTVQEANVHSSEEYVFALKLEHFVVECIQMSADNPHQILHDSSGNIQDVVKSLHSLRKLYRTMKVGSPGRYLRPSQVLGSAEIKILIDTIRVHVNTSKHEREHKGIVFGTDFRAVTQYARLMRSCLFLVEGSSSIASKTPINSVPRFPKLEKMWVMRLLLARQNSASAVDKVKLASLRRQIPLIPFTSFPRSIKTLSLDILPSVRWVDVNFIVKDCRDALEDVFKRWIARYRQEPFFNNLYLVLRQKTVSDLACLIRSRLLSWNDDEDLKFIKKTCFSLRDGGEASYVLDTILLEHRLAEHYTRIQDRSLHASAHELFAVLAGTIEIMIVLKSTGYPFFAEALKLFDSLLFLFTESIDIRTPGLLALDLGVYEDMEEEAPGIAFYDIDFNEFDKGNPHLFKLIGHWEDPHPLSAPESSLAFSQHDPPTPASLPTPDDEISTERFDSLLKTENAVWERTGGYVAFEILSEEARARKSLRLIRRLFLIMLESLLIGVVTLCVPGFSLMS